MTQMETVWILTVALFINGESQIQNQQEFVDLDRCIEVSRNVVREHAERTDRANNEHITASCAPSNRPTAK